MLTIQVRKHFSKKCNFVRMHLQSDGLIVERGGLLSFRKSFSDKTEKPRSKRFSNNKVSHKNNESLQLQGAIGLSYLLSPHKCSSSPPPTLPVDVNVGKAKRKATKSKRIETEKKRKQRNRNDTEQKRNRKETKTQKPKHNQTEHK